MDKKPIAAALGAGALACMLAAASQAQQSGGSWSDEVVDMATQGKIHLDLRYRYEYVDQDGIDRDAGASTLRTRLGYTSAVKRGLSFGLEFDNVSVIGSERYNSTENGETSYPVVADPKGTDINQVWLKYAGDNFGGTYGRQRILHSNQRFIGGVAWRQNEQTYDGFRATWKPLDGLNFDYSYVYNVKRIFGPDDGANPADLHGENHFIYADYTFADKHKFAGFGYLIDVDPQSNYASGKAEDNSSDTWGVEYSGDFDILKLKAAWATQSDAGNSTRDYDADYYLVEASGNIGPVGLVGGYEVLGAGDGVGFKTPYATLHKFQGWADKFLGTPDDGIEDLYIGANGKIGPVKLAAVYHDFSAEDGSDDFGSEINLVATWPVTKNFTTQFKFADFSTDNKARFADTTKAWVTLQFKI